LEMGVLQTICLGWPWTKILLISASQVAKITGMSHWHQAKIVGFCSFEKHWEGVCPHL
jgi:hypothetical protein